ncbi:hypothetical protein SAMN05444008_11549 [Cnuella takakiae]|uniref:Uncharacterized protein n=1 Tax=Cnuella takakiae TaxID=1302690 RepID=A0A1M5G1B3_9BACT|nr:hypothetical protein [Cnuella takakiae]OLY92283.1 hypothetical protein BUE76_10555 [Cnuella takakiae]SHF97232.1 hypothetical protein SAMN05444008_11549 [Cnuella takakiae]
MKELKSSSEGQREAIELYLVSEEGTVTLTDKQQELLQRWEYADELIRQKEIRKREAIAKLIMFKFKVSRTTAYQDIVNAEHVFASSTPLNKRYKVQTRIEFLEEKIDELYGKVEPSTVGEDMDVIDAAMQRKNNEEYINQAVALEKVLQKYYDIYPDIRPARSPKKIVFNVFGGQVPESVKDAGKDAMAKAKQIIELKRKEDGSFGA